MGSARSTTQLLTLRSLPALPAAILANVLGDLWNWIAEVGNRIGDVSACWLVAALALKTAESAFIGLSWRNILRAAYPTSNLSFKIAWGASRGGRQSTRCCLHRPAPWR